MNKRPNGDGSIYRSDGGGWRAAVSFVDPVTGETKRLRKRARTKAEALAHLRAMQRELEDHGRPADTDRLLTATIEDYLDVRAAEDLQLGSLLNDKWAMSIITKGLGRKPVATLSVQDCDKFLIAASHGRFGGPLGRDQLKRLRSRLIKAIDNDRRRGLVTRNVADLSVVPVVSSTLTPGRAARVLPAEDLEALLASADGAVGVLIDLSSRHGLRPAEARGLRWSRVDLDGGTVRIDAQINRRNEITKAKARRAYRTIQVDSETTYRLADRRQAQEQARQEAGPAWSGNPQDLIATTAFGTSINQRNVHRSLTQLSRKLNLEPTVAAYDLRHTAISFQVEKGHSIHQVADWAGTSESMIINVYRHKLKEISNRGPSNHQQ